MRHTLLTLFVLLGLSQVVEAQIIECRLTAISDNMMTVDVRVASGETFTQCQDFFISFSMGFYWDNASEISNVTVLTEGSPFNCLGGGYQFSIVEEPTDLGDGRSVVPMRTDWVFTTPITWDDSWTPIATLTVVTSAPEGAASANGVTIFPANDPKGPMGDGTVPLAFTPTVAWNGPTVINMQVVPDPLPVTMLSFEAIRLGDRSVKLDWATADEENTSHFVVERSRDGQEWEDIGSVQAAGESQARLDYSFVDKNVFNGRSAQARFYYRLRAMDTDGQFERTEIEAIVFKAEGPGSEVYAYPNPSSIGLNVEFNAQDRIPSRMELFDASGRIVYSTVLTEGTEIEYIDYSRLSITSGTYILRVADENEETISTDKIIVSR